MSKWNDLIDEITDLDVDAEEQTTTPAGESEEDQTPGESEEKEVESTSDEEGQKSEESDETEGDDDSTDQADAKDTDADEEKDSEEKQEDSDEQTFEFDGKTYTLEQMREFRDNGMTQKGFTQQRQKDAAQRKQEREEYEAKMKLAEDISEDAGMREFLKAHPEGIKYLMADPEGTRSMLGDTKKVEAFWKDYEVLLENPEIAERLAKAESRDDAADDLEVERQVETMERVVAGLGYAVDQVAEHYPDVDPNEVKQYLVELSGLPDKDELTLAEQQAAVSTLWNLFYVQNEETGELSVRPQLIVSHFERLKAAAGVDAPDREAVEEHNKQVDEKLKDDKAPPKTPEGKTPLTEAERGKMPENFRAALEDILE